jgi:hypothetical protein
VMAVVAAAAAMAAAAAGVAVVAAWQQRGSACMIFFRTYEFNHIGMNSYCLKCMNSNMLV